MKISELIKELEKELDRVGDIEVVVNGYDFTTNAIYLDYAPYYYDGGVTIKNPKYNFKDEHCNRWSKSKKHPEFGDRYLHIRCDEPCLVDGNEYIEKTYIPEINTDDENWEKDFDSNLKKNWELYRKA